MLRTLLDWKGRRRGRLHARSYPIALQVRPLEERCLLSVEVVQTNLVSDGFVPAVHTDPNLVNPWGIAASPSGPFWVSDNGTGVSTLYDTNGNPQSLVVTIPPPSGGTPPAAPTGIVFNGTPDFVIGHDSKGNPERAFFIFSTEDGTISGWNPKANLTQAVLEVDNSNRPPGNGAVYKGLAIGASNGANYLYATNFRAGTIDVFDTNFQPVHFKVNDGPGFTDRHIPDGFAPFGIQNLNGELYVTYAKQNASKHDDVAGPGNGFVDVYSTDGHLLQRLLQHGQLNSPWGLTIAPAGFGSVAGDLLVGNFGDGEIHAYDPTNGHNLGALVGSDGQPIVIGDLWALTVGNGGNGGNAGTVYFTAGVLDEAHGLLGSLQAVPTFPKSDPLLSDVANSPEQTFSTIPPNGDLNPYGVAFVPNDIASGGVLQPGDVLVSNFNSSSNQQGTGTTIVRFTPQGGQSVFFQGSPGLGLTTALGVLKSGFVIVGNVPTDQNGSPQQGSLLIIDSNGNLVTQLSDANLLNGPWDLALNDHGDHAQVFVSNVLSGTITRIDLQIPSGGTPIVTSMTQIASGYSWRPDPNALVVGPTGLAYDVNTGRLYVASTEDNAIYVIPHASAIKTDHGTGNVVVQNDPNLHGPLGLVLAPNGDLVATNGDAINTDPNNLNTLVEFTPDGQFVTKFQLDTGNGGAAFGIALTVNHGQWRFAAIDDNANTVNIWTFRLTGSAHPESNILGGDGMLLTNATAIDHLFSLLAQEIGNQRHDLWGI